MRRRDFIARLGAAVVWSAELSSRIAGAQPVGRVARVGVLMYGGENDPDLKSRLSAFTQSLAELGWTSARNLRLDVRWSATEIERVRLQAAELVALEPDVVVATSTVITTAFQRETQKIPIVFVGISDPVGSGFVANLARPGGNLTGFINIEGGMSGKWLELLKEIAPGIKRVALMYSPNTATGAYYMPSLEAAARSLGVVPIEAPVRTDEEIRTAIDSLGGEHGGGLILPPDGFTSAHRATISALTLSNKVPSVAAISVLPKAGSLLSYGPDFSNIYERAANYVDRILRGARSSELPVQLPIKFEMVINLGTAKALGLTVPQSILLRADEVIE
jgi:putative tryptophan/tyrosine transport system substrate-binding protein